ncbi:MAG: peptidylprolyl isomerase [Saprospiraceae bacterium]|nr:peptidylprolyl isomerase [Saprospiraceae bacterium]
MNYLLKILPLFFICSGQLWGQEPMVIDKVVATVGDEIILLSDVEEQYDYDRERLGTLSDIAKCGILERIMVQKLLINQAKLDSVIVGDDQVEQQLNSRIDYILSLMNNDISQFEEYYGKTVAQVRNEMREELRGQITAEQMQAMVIENTTITPSEVKAYFDKIPKDSLPYFSSEVEIGEVVVKPQVSATERQIALDRIESLRDRILAGENFAELATKFSDDPGSAKVGGDLGLQKRGTFVPEFEAAAYNLTEGEISEIVESPFGFHLIELLERKGNLIHTRHILIKPKINPEDLELAKNKLDSIRTIFLTDSISFEELVKKYSDEDVQSYNNGGRMINPASGNTFFETAELDADIFFAIDTLEVGEISKPIQFKSPTGEIAFRIVLLQSLTDPHQANLKQDYTKIKTAAIEERKVEFLNRWIDEKVLSTFIEVTPSFKEKCANLEKWSSKSLKTGLSKS